MWERVGVRALRQNLSVYLRRIHAGEAFEVTDRGRPVALLSPLPDERSVRDRLVVEGRLVPARGRLADLAAPRPVPIRISVSEAVRREREEGTPC
jgi:antitoxin (DNA-binding transcriptional repressor) of toxin-antitoxin stability system